MIWMDVDAALAEVPINIAALIDDTDFKTREQSVTYDQSGLDLLWNFVTTAGAFAQTAVTPTDTGGDYDFVNQGNGMYTIEIPASSGASINNDTEGFGWFSGFATGVLPWIGPVIGFRAAALNNALIDGGDNLDTNVVQWLGTAAATPDTAGIPMVNCEEWAGTSVTISDTTAKPEVDVFGVSDDATAANNLELQYDTTGIVGDTFPATQASVSNIANIGSAVSKTPASYVLTTGTQSSGTVASVAALDGTNHEHTDDGGAMDLYYEFLIGSGTPSSVTMTGYLNSANDNLEVYGYDWVAAGWVQIGQLSGKGASTNEVDSYELFVNMVGSGSDEGKVRVRFTDGAFTLTSATLAVDQIFCSFSQGAEGYDNGAVWLDSTRANTNTVVGIDGVARNAVSTLAAGNTLLAATNLHRFEIAPGSTFTLGASQTNETFNGRDWTLALGSRDITGSFFLGAMVSGTGTATAGYEFEECDIGAVTLDNDGHFERCSLTDTFTVGQAGTFSFHQCFTKASGNIVLDFGGLGATTVHMFDFHGNITPTNMATGDILEVTGAGTITTATCTAGTIDHDGFFEYTDAGTNVTEQQSDIKVAVDAIEVDTRTTIPALIATAQADLDIITGFDGVNLLSADKTTLDAIPTFSEIWTTALTESYGADGAAFTGAQGLFMMWSAMMEQNYSGTTGTFKKLDGSTTAFTGTLDSATVPTSITRAT